MALSKDEIALFKEMIADPSVPKEEKDMYREALGEFGETKKETPKKETPPKAKKKTPKKRATKKP